jgi:hypothetical protein
MRPKSRNCKIGLQKKVKPSEKSLDPARCDAGASKTHPLHPTPHCRLELWMFNSAMTARDCLGYTGALFISCEKH